MTDPIQDYIDEVDAEEPEQQEEAPAAPEPEAPAQDEEQEELLVGRFKSPEELAKGYENLEAKLNEQGAELGELRKLREQAEWYAEQQQSQGQQVPLNQETVDWFDEQVMENPAGAATWAMQNDPSGVLWNRAIDGWYDINPRQAAQFERQWEMAALAHSMEQRFGGAVQPLVESQSKQDFVTAWESAADQLPGLNELSETIIEIAQESPEILRSLESGTPESKQRVIHNLYYQARGRQAETTDAATTNAAVTQAESNRNAKRQAGFVAPAGGRPSGEKRTNVEQWLEEVFDPAASQYYGE